MKNLFRLFGFLAIVGLMTSCGSDDPESWTLLPDGNITTESGDLSLSVNGQLSNSGSAQFKATSATEGVITLINAIPGYAEVPVNVTLAEQQNGTFNFQGTTDITTAPSRAAQARSENAFMTLNVSGTVTTDGKAMVSVTASGAAFYIGVYRNDSLSLSYCNIPCPGRAVAYSAMNDVPVLTLIGVIPGDYTVAIPAVYPDAQGSFNGETTTTNGTSVKYKGQFNAGSGILTLNVEPTLSAAMQGGIAQTWNLSLDPESTTDNDYNYIPSPYPPFRLTWTPKDMNKMSGVQLATLASRAVSHFMVNLLSNITLNPNGTFAAKYGDIETIEDQIPDFDDADMMTLAGWFLRLLDVNMIPTQTKWYESPLGMAYWYCKDGYFYFVPDIMSIIGQVDADDPDSDLSPEMIMGLISQLSQMEPQALLAYANQILPSLGIQGVDLSDVNPEVIRTILSWLQTGVPLRYKVDGTYLSLYIDKEMAEPFMTILFKFLPMAQGAIDKAAAGNPMMGMMWTLLGITKLTDLQTIWTDNTAEFKIALNFNNAPASKASRKASKPAVSNFENPEQAIDAIKLMLGK
ncbi:MAG: DUF4925 domain-containing protein [Duncaniella sp.]|nr:DUF4925 domain-containing protein [Muribaculum sp.]MCM1255548.1 DUF4925 domain-containing protein [Duncaniella sp.]